MRPLKNISIEHLQRVMRFARKNGDLRNPARRTVLDVVQREIRYKANEAALRGRDLS